MRLHIIAPKSLWNILHTNLSLLYPNLEIQELPDPQVELINDPFGCTEITHSLSRKHECILLISPRRRSPARLIPSPVINDIPISIVQANKEIHLIPWLTSLQNKPVKSEPNIWAVLAMWKDIYLEWGERFSLWMEKGSIHKGVNIQKWFSDRISRDELCNLLSQGPSLVLYLGHGRTRGWSGYRGIRWTHITSSPMKKPCGIVASLSCDTLKKKQGRVPFGSLWVEKGRACLYFGSVDRLGYAPNAAFAKVLGQVIGKGTYQNFGDVLTNVNATLLSKPEMRAARTGFNSYRMIGDPLQQI